MQPLRHTHLVDQIFFFEDLLKLRNMCHRSLEVYSSLMVESCIIKLWFFALLYIYTNQRCAPPRNRFVSSRRKNNHNWGAGEKDISPYDACPLVASTKKFMLYSTPLAQACFLLSIVVVFITKFYLAWDFSLSFSFSAQFETDRKSLWKFCWISASTIS